MITHLLVQDDDHEVVLCGADVADTDDWVCFYEDDATCPACGAALEADDGHVTDGGECWCCPVVEHHEGGDLVIHHSREEAH